MDATTVIEVAVSGVLADLGVSSWEVAVGRRAYDLPGLLHDPLVVAMQVGTRGMVIAAALLIWWWWDLRAGLTVFAAGAGAWALAATLKLFELRPRPTDGTLGRSVREVVDGAGFPSTHSAIAMGLAVVISLDQRCPRWLVALAGALALTTMIARMHLGVHWFLDVVAGAAIGAAAAIVARWTTSPRQQPA